MRVSLVIFFALFVVMVNSATTKTTRRPVALTTKRGVTQAAKPKSAYAYLRSVRGKTSCASGTCPFWERHGRSFAALRCYSQQYQECTCLHRMCFSSCFFSRKTCNEEMVSCLQQICPRCMPASALPMCKVYDSMAKGVAEALSAFACYPCCTKLVSLAANITNAQNAGAMTQSVNSGNAMIQGSSGAGGSVNSVNGGQNAGSTNGANQVNAGNQNNVNGNNNNVANVVPGNSVANISPNQNGQIRQAGRVQTTTRRALTTTRRATTKAQKKPQTNKQ